MTGWWFQTWLDYFPFHIWDTHPNWLSYFSKGLKPPTRWKIVGMVEMSDFVLCKMVDEDAYSSVKVTDHLLNGNINGATVFWSGFCLSVLGENFAHRLRYPLFAKVMWLEHGRNGIPKTVLVPKGSVLRLILGSTGWMTLDWLFRVFLSEAFYGWLTRWLDTVYGWIVASKKITLFILMSTPDETKPWFINLGGKFGGYSSNSHNLILKWF